MKEITSLAIQEQSQNAPILANTSFERINNNVFLKVLDFLGENGNVYQSLEVYYQNTGEKFDLGSIYYEDPSHLEVGERYIFNGHYLVLLRRNFARNQILDFKIGFDVRSKKVIKNEKLISKMYVWIMNDKNREIFQYEKEYDPISLIVEGTSKLLEFLNPFNKR